METENKKILLVEDDVRLSSLIAEYLSQNGLKVATQLRGDDAVDDIIQQQPDLVILDIMLPGLDGFEVCKRIRQTHDLPIIMLTARGDVTDRIVGLEIGADDYIPKPFDPRELVARLQVNIKRHGKTSGQSTTSEVSDLYFEGLSLHPLQREIKVNGKPVELTTKEFSLLQLLSESPGRAFSRDEILATLKGTENELFTRSVDILVSRLRAKLKPLQPIRTLHGAGYAFVLSKIDPPQNAS